MASVVVTVDCEGYEGVLLYSVCSLSGSPLTYRCLTVWQKAWWLIMAVW